MATFMKASPATLTRESGGLGERALDVTAVHSTHADFVFRSLSRLGVREPDLLDALQEVFVVVHRRASSYDGTSKLTSWLFGICLRVAAAHRRKLYRRREQPLGDELELGQSEQPGPEQAVAAKQARAELEAILEQLSLDKRAVFVMFEIEAMSCAEIAATLELPLGTVHSRLHAARHEFARILERRRTRRGGR
jgi:RNA polymerase sigma-70 factor (ECF subfamily)